ncbi:hypothetical protein N431DRAFT_359019 [Stipitochalara longipes BDJ]|nr:hypothetical protein N431DRAFT_359019 [Stipitochalara longipes BDJ]
MMASTFPGVTVRPAPHGANALSDTHGRALKSGKELFRNSCYKEFAKIKNDHIIQSSFDDPEEGFQFLGANNGFVNAAVKSYSQHHHLIIRPEDVWFSVLVQLNVYINEHAEELRSMFVAHKGQKRLQLEVTKAIAGNAFFGVDWSKFSYQMGKMIEENILDPSLREWFMPAFTTTTKSDQATASIIMMSSMQKYFTFGCSIGCGLPSVTLQGQKKDWEKMLGRLERLKTFGEEPTRWYELLKPVFIKFVETFDAPKSEAIKDFWQKIAHYSGGGSGPTYLSGWITAFCFWNDQGKCFNQPGKNPSSEESMHAMGAPTPVLCLDNARYHRIDSEDVPAGWTSVPVELNDDGFIYNAAMVAGSVGMQISSSGTKLHGWKGGKGIDTVQPLSGWWMYETRTEDEILEEKRIRYEEMRKNSSFLPEWKGKESLMWLGEY